MAQDVKNCWLPGDSSRWPLKIHETLTLGWSPFQPLSERVTVSLKGLNHLVDPDLLRLEVQPIQGATKWVKVDVIFEAQSQDLPSTPPKARTGRWFEIEGWRLFFWWQCWGLLFILVTAWYHFIISQLQSFWLLLCVPGCHVDWGKQWELSLKCSGKEGAEMACMACMLSHLPCL